MLYIVGCLFCLTVKINGTIQEWGHGSLKTMKICYFLYLTKLKEKNTIEMVQKERGDSIDAFIDNKAAKEITIINKSSKDDTGINKISVERYGDEYVCNGKTYKYFYKITHSEGNEISQDYILGNVILDEKEYNNYIANSTQGENAPLIVASNIEK